MKQAQLFTISYNSQRLTNLPRDMRTQRHTALGTLYHTTGRISLDTGVTFETMTELQLYFSRSGFYRIIYHNQPNRRRRTAA